MRKKTFRIGESAYYGIWKIEVNEAKGTVKLIGVEWGTNVVKEEKSFNLTERAAISEYAESQSTSYHAGQMLNFIYKETKN